MLEGKLIIIPPLEVKSNLTGSGLFVLMSQWGNNNELALQHGGFCTIWSFVAKGLFRLSNEFETFILKPEWDATLNMLDFKITNDINVLIMGSTFPFCRGIPPWDSANTLYIEREEITG